MFADLSKMIEEKKPLVKEFTNQKVVLTEKFKELYLEIEESIRGKIEFYSSFALVTTKTQLHVYVPNQWFYLAFIGAPLTKEIVEYKGFIKEKSGLKGESFEKFILSAKKNKLDNNIFEKIITDLDENQKSLIKKILTDYEWWDGAKDLARNDYYVSPVLKMLDLQNVSSTYVADLSSILSRSDIPDNNIESLFILVDEEKNSFNYEEQFRQWIIEKKDSVQSNLKYVDTLNRFAEAVNLELSEEDFTPISVWQNPKQFAKKYPLDHLMDIAKRLKPNTAFVPKSGSGSELKTIFNKYLLWTDQLADNRIIDEHRQYIYIGAPGTGKSYQLKKDSRLFGNNIERVTFHPNMSYGSFVGVFKPFPQKIKLRNSNGDIVQDSNGGSLFEERISYKFVPGPLIKQLVKALMHPEKAYLLIVEEINRANVAAVFGDLFQLLDRNSDYSSEYPISISEDLQQYFETVYNHQKDDARITYMKEKLRQGLVFPSNFYIWTTMNSSDQGVMPMDTAFKRRWEQKYFGLDDAWDDKKDGKKRFSKYEKINYKNKNDGISEQKTISWNVLRRIINDMLSLNKNIPEDKLLGPYFISENILKSTTEAVTDTFKSKVLMYLFDDVAKQDRKIIFKNVKKMRYSEILNAFDDIGLALFGITDETIENYEKEEFSRMN